MFLDFAHRRILKNFSTYSGSFHLAKINEYTAPAFRLKTGLDPSHMALRFINTI